MSCPLLLKQRERVRVGEGGGHPGEEGRELKEALQPVSPSLLCEAGNRLVGRRRVDPRGERSKQLTWWTGKGAL